jgi:hypothetical protein
MDIDVRRRLLALAALVIIGGGVWACATNVEQTASDDKPTATSARDKEACEKLHDALVAWPLRIPDSSAWLAWTAAAESLEDADDADLAAQGEELTSLIAQDAVDRMVPIGLDAFHRCVAVNQIGNDVPAPNPTQPEAPKDDQGACTKYVPAAQKAVDLVNEWIHDAGPNTTLTEDQYSRAGTILVDLRASADLATPALAPKLVRFANAFAPVAQGGDFSSEEFKAAGTDAALACRTHATG